MTPSDLDTSPGVSAAPQPPVTRGEWWTIGALTAAFLALVTFWATFTPIYDAPDEPLHMNSAIRLTTGWDWPAPGDAQLEKMVLAARAEADIPAAERSTFAQLAATHPGYNGVDQMTQHPPLYYAYVAVVLNAVDYMNIRADLALLAARLAGLVFAAPLPFLVWQSVRRITRSPRAAIIGAAALFAVPQLAHILGSVSNDGATIAFASVVVWLGIRVMTGDRRWWTVAGMGLALGLALLTKGTAVPLVPFVAIVLLFWPRELSLRERVLRLTTGAAVALVGGWWWIRNVIVYHALQPAGLVYPAVAWPEGSGPDVRYFSEQLWDRVSLSFWGNFGWLNHPMPTYVTDILTVVSLAVVIGYAFRRSAVRAQMWVLASLTLFFLVALLYQTWPSYVRSTLPAGLQGRYFFVVIVPLIVLSAVGWRRLIADRERRATATGLLSVFFIVAAIGLWVELRAAYAGVTGWLHMTPVGALPGVFLALLCAGLAAAALALSIRFVWKTPQAAPLSVNSGTM